MRSQDFVLQREHARRGFIDVPDEGDRRLQDRLEPGTVLEPGLRVLVLDDEVRVRDVEREQFPRGQLMIEPVDAAVLQIRQRIVARRAR